MDHFKGVEVEVSSNGQILPLYDDPDAPDNHNSRERQRYIQATTGANFAIKVTLTKDFEFGESQATRVGIAFDGDPKPWYSMIKKKAWLFSRSGTFHFSHLVTYCAASSSWKQSDFMFGGLDISNDSFLRLYRNDADYVLSAESTNSRIQSAQLKGLGQIQLIIERTNVEILRNPYPFSKKQLSRVAEVSEKTLKGSAISSTVR